jgi:hypothetical protein
MKLVQRYCGVINLTGAGEDPDTVGVEAVAVLLHPATFSTVNVTAGLFGPARILSNTKGAEEAVSSQSWPGSRIMHRVAVAVSPPFLPGSKVRSACTPPPTMPQAYTVLWSQPPIAS